MKKWSKIIKIMLLFVGFACTDNLFSEQLAVAVKQFNRQAQSPQEWFEKMKKKYPKAGLENITLIDGRGWAMGHLKNGSAFVTCPYDTYDGIKPFTADDELALLHEAGHARNHRWTKLFYKKSYQKTFATALILASFLSTDGIQKSKNLAANPFAEKTSPDFAEKFCKFVALYGVISAVLYKIIPPIANRFDETLADDFAKKHGDAEALKGGYVHFMNHAKRQKSAYKNFIEHWKKDFAHPASYDRAQAIAKVLWEKHGQAVPMIY